MATILNTKSIYFTDFNILPGYGDANISSRKYVDTELHRICVSPMVSVVGNTFIKEAAKLGLSVTTPRFLSIEQKIKLYFIFEGNKINNKQLCFISIGLNEPQDELEKLSHNTDCRNILFDIANGYMDLEEHVKRVWSEFKINNLMVGNIITGRGLINLIESLDKYCDNLYVRCGTGNGSPCSSSDCASINRGQATELIECEDIKNQQNKYYLTQKIDKKINIGSDGGLYKPAFAVKAFGCGADFVLMGGFFSKALEAETHISGNGQYYGCASSIQNKLAGLDDKPVEGKIIDINKKELRPLKDLVKELNDGIASGLSYCRYKNVTDFVGNAVIELKYSPLPPKNRY